MANAAVKASQEQGVMEFSVDKGEFLKSLSKLQSIVERRNTMPILGNVLLSIKGDKLHLTVTDMDIYASDEISVKSEEDSSLTVPALTLYDIVRKLPEGSEISIIADPKTSQVKVSSGSSKFKLSYLPADQFPVISSGEFPVNFSMNGKEFQNLLAKSRFAMSTEETRYYLNGVYFHVAQSNENNDKVLRSVATDGHRLARVQTGLPDGAANMPGVIIPRKTVGELAKLLDGAEEIEIGVSDTKIQVKSGGLRVLSKLVDGTFPDYDRVIPSSNDKILEVDNAMLTQAVDRVATINTDKTRSIKFSITQGNLALNSQSSEAGTADEILEVSYSADPVEIGFNSRYVLDVTSQIDGDTVQFLLNDSNSPVIVKDPNDIGALFVIMPMRVA